MNSLSVLGKYLDQPRLVGRFSKAVPTILVVGAGAYTLGQTYKAPKEERKKTLIKNGLVLGGTIISAMVAPKIASKIIKGHHHEHHHEHADEAKELITEFLKENKVSKKTEEILEKAKEKILKSKEIKTIFEELKPESNKKAQEFLSGEEGLIPDPENIDSKHIFGEIGELSIIGLLPVLGGIAGGIAADKITEKNWKEKLPNKIKEGSYQYLANIFLCNIGAGVALLALERAKIQSKGARAIGMISGILLTGLVAGSAMANYIGKKLIDPLFNNKHKKGENIYSERTPELLDVSLHVDDMATVAVLSGLKWIAPALPILYSISGYRAGIGYRNKGNAK